MVNLIAYGGEVMTNHSMSFKSDPKYVPSISVKGLKTALEMITPIGVLNARNTIQLLALQ